MLKDITLGQYFAGDTVVHRLDPRTKLILVVVYIVTLFSAKWFVTYGIVLLTLAGVILAAQIAPKTIIKSLKPLLFIIVLTGILNLFYTQGEPLVQIWVLTTTKEGLQGSANRHAHCRNFYVNLHDFAHRPDRRSGTTAESSEKD